MLALVAVACGGALGALSRFAVVSSLGVAASGFPWATLLINLSGSLLIGLWYELALSFSIDAEWRLLVQMGFLGAFTTFSTLSLELLLLLEARAYVTATSYLLASCIGGVLVAIAGMRIAVLLRSLAG